ncbi:conjugative transposon protein TraK [Parasegetibacter sp. MAH-26]|uniref:Conjugative transposon protein TraK n=2 Tax=Pinibacter aurantiacus TaxID=2851599 RepID=A0A9E2S9E7_9BACT|nr:conjugative transposon protein TraK [Pinibacter aurantiacus]
MFSKMKHIDTAFRYVRAFTFVIILGSLVLCGFVIYKSYELASIAKNKVYVLASGKALEALAADRKDNIPVEAKDHVYMFHHYFFTLDPDDKVIQRNITKALYLSDASAKRQYENLKESGYYSNIIAGNISQQISIDSIQINVDTYPYYFRCYGTQQIIRATSIVYWLLITEGYLRNVERSENNSHGFLVEKWHTIENRDEKTVNR